MIASKELVTSVRSAHNVRWLDVSNHKKYFDQLAQKLSIKKMEDWYDIDSMAIRSREYNVGGLLRHYYNSSLSDALLTIYHDHPWDVFRFHNKNKNYWTEMRNQRQFFDWMAQKLGIKQHEVLA